MSKNIWLLGTFLWNKTTSGWPFLRSNVIDTHCEGPITLYMIYFDVWGYKSKVKYLRGDNSYKELSDPFATNVTKLQEDASNNMQKIFCRYLLRFRRRSAHKVFRFWADNSVRNKVTASLTKFRKGYSLTVSWSKHLYDMSQTHLHFLR